MKVGFTVHHNGPPAKCVGRPHQRCIDFWRIVCDFHGKKFGAKWAPTSLYSFGVCPHGVRFTGRDWHQNQAANGRDVVGPDDGADKDWYSVLVFLGTDEKPTAEMILAVRDLVVEGRDARRCGLRLLPHNAFKIKPCPGPEFTAWCAAWDRKPFAKETAPVAIDPEAVVLNTYAAQLGRDPESLETIAAGVHAIGTRGEAAYVADIANSAESQAYKAALRKLKGG